MFVQDGDQETILHSEFFLLKSTYAGEDAVLSFTVPLLEPLPPQYFIRAVSDRWLGAEATLPVSFRRLLLPEKNPPPTELLDLQPLPVSALRRPALEALYSPRFRHFNPVQTQAFSALFNTDDNVLVAAPTGSGKTICAEFAIARLLQPPAEPGGPCTLSGRVVYIAPGEALAHERFVDWSATWGRALGLVVAELTGEGDLKMLDRADICVATPERWDMLSRRWKQRRAVQSVALFVADELHLIGGEHGPVMEVCVSRMRYISSQAERPIRLVGLASSLANARDVGEWLGAPPAALFNFPPSVRPVPLDVHVTGVDIVNFESRMQAMARPVYAAITQHAAPRDGVEELRPAIVFVPSRKHAKLAALDLLTFVSSEGAPHRFLHTAEEDLAPFLAAVRDPAVRHALSYGIALLHEGLGEGERAAVEALFESGAAGVLVATAPLCWGLAAAAHLVVVMGTQLFDSTRAAGTADYPLTDLLQMVGRAGRPGVDARGVAVLLCHAPRKEYYKRFLYSPIPVESHLDACLHDHLCAAGEGGGRGREGLALVVCPHDAPRPGLAPTLPGPGTAARRWSPAWWRTSRTRWTTSPGRCTTAGWRAAPGSRLGGAGALTRRPPAHPPPPQTRNPNYYNLTGTTHRHLSDHLSELVESCLADLEASKCIAVEDETELLPLNLGMIAAYYYISYTTMELFAASLTAKTKLKGVLEILSAAAEYAHLPLRPGEEEAVRRLLLHAPLTLEGAKPTEPSAKANALLQAHLSRRPVAGDLALDQKAVLLDAPRLLQALVDCVASSGWLAPALAAMELCQLLTQGLWAKDPPLMQLPHVTRDAAARARAAGVESVFDLLEAEEGAREALLAGLPPRARQELVRAANRFPSIEVAFDPPPGPVGANDPVLLTVGLDREAEGDGPLPPVAAPRFPKAKEEAWWLVVGSPKTGQLAAIKRVTLARKLSVKLEFAAPADAGLHDMALFFMCDSYVGADQQFDFALRVTEADEPAEPAEAAAEAADMET